MPLLQRSASFVECLRRYDAPTYCVSPGIPL